MVSFSGINIPRRITFHCQDRDGEMSPRTSHVDEVDSIMGHILQQGGPDMYRLVLITFRPAPHRVVPYKKMNAEHREPNRDIHE